MEKLKIRLFRTAVIEHGMKIKPCADRESLSDCFTEMIVKGKKYLAFWFNDDFGSTHMIKGEIE